MIEKKVLENVVKGPGVQKNFSIIESYTRYSKMSCPGQD